MSHGPGVIQQSAPSPWRPEFWLGITGWLRWGAIAVIVLLIAMTTLVVYAGGGAQTAYTNLILFPGLLSAALFGYRGGMLCGLVTGLLLGPYMPLDAAAGIAQPHGHWIARLVIFITVAGIAGWLFEELRVNSRRLLTQARTNAITGLPNRHSLEMDLAEHMVGPDTVRPAKATKRLYVLSVELERYRDTVCTLGLAVERPLLRDIAARLCRAMEPYAGRVYHINEDHFMALLADQSRRECLGATRQAAKLLQQPFTVWRESQFTMTGIPVYLDVHCGVAAYPFHERNDPGRLIAKAWTAMYATRSAGRRYGSYDRHLDENSLHMVETLGELQTAIDGDQFLLHYQPYIDAGEGMLLGVEALLRWQHRRHGLMPPSEFIPLAEQTGLIHPLTRWVLRTALAETRALRRDGRGVTLSVNISPRNFLDRNFVDEVLLLAEQAELRPGELELEFTETAVMLDPEDVLKQLARLTEAGIKLSLDDFGTGHSSLAYLKRFPVSTLKIDKGFVRDMAHNRADAEIVGASIAMARNLGLRTIAEGVEDEHTLALLRELGCDAAQGYGIAPPMPAAEIRAWAPPRRRPIRPSRSRSVS